MIYDLVRLRAETENIIEYLRGVEEDLFPNDPINWGDLHCIEAARVVTDDGREYYRVRIEEASEDCREFPIYVQRKLAKLGFNDIEVSTEW